MAMEIKLDQRLATKLELRLNPQLLQSLKIIQISRLELADLIKKELQENPLLEEKNIQDQSPPFTEEKSFLKEEEKEDYTEELTPAEREELVNIDFDWEDHFSLASDTSYVLPDPSQANFLENVLTQLPSLQDHLLWQLRLSCDKKEEYLIGEEIIGNINENGYLCVSLEEIQQKTKAGLEKVYEILLLIQSFEPLGVGARNLKETLLIQKRALYPDEPLVGRIILNCLEKVSIKDHLSIAERLGASLPEVEKAVEIISKLDPYPGQKYNPEQPKYVVPDIIVTKVEGKYEFVLNNEGLPPLKINSFYKKMLAQKEKLSPEVYKYILEKLRKAKEIIRNVDLRHSTLYKVTESIFAVQRDFLEKGVQFLKPLTLEQVATATGLHASTVCRATTNKFVETPQGIFELKYFFASGTRGGEIQRSSLSFKEIIKEFIHQEDPTRPYSDQEIVDYLRKQGLEIARRTVAKYREALNIPSSNKRRRKKILSSPKGEVATLR